MDRDWPLIGVFLAWSATPWVLVTLAWRKWARSRVSLMEGVIDDPAFLIGQVLATVSCCALVPFYLSASQRWEQLRVDALGWGLIITVFSVFMAMFILPFGLSRARWLSFVSCLRNLGIVVMFFLTLE
jgi:hypothetical protein